MELDFFEWDSNILGDDENYPVDTYYKCTLNRKIGRFEAGQKIDLIEMDLHSCPGFMEFFTINKYDSFDGIKKTQIARFALQLKITAEDPEFNVEPD